MSNCHLLVQDNVLQNYIFKQSFGAVTLLIDNILQTALFTLLNVFKISFICSSILRRGIVHLRLLMVSLVFMGSFGFLRYSAVFNGFHRFSGSSGFPRCSEVF